MKGASCVGVHTTTSSGIIMGLNFELMRLSSSLPDLAAELAVPIGSAGSPLGGGVGV